MINFVDGYVLAQPMYAAMRRDIAALRRYGVTPKLGVVLVGNHKPSATYVRKKEEAARSVGVTFELAHLPASSSPSAIIATLHAMQQKRRGFSGIIVQLPLPHPAMTNEVLEALQPTFDVDCLTATNCGRLMNGNPLFFPPTPWAMLHILEHHHIALTGKHVVVIGAGQLVGRPLVNALMHHGATVSVLNNHTPHLSAFTKKADIIMTGVGKHGILDGRMIRRGAIVIDAGASFAGSTLRGDIDMESVARRASLATPTPGGVGPLTVAKLMRNTIDSARYGLQ